MSRKVELSNLCELVRHNKVLVTTHSDSVQQGAVFVLLPLAVPVNQSPNDFPRQHGYVQKALIRGASHIVCEQVHADALLPLCTAAGARLLVVDSARQALGKLAQARYKTDVRCPRIIGITGTNGKTTETYLLEYLFSRAGYRVGVLGTVMYRWPGHQEDAPLTTPGCLQLHDYMSQMADANVDIVFMEISSHAVDQERIAGLSISGILLTNVTQDHLDYHLTMEHYFTTKLKLFLSPEKGGVPFADKVCVANGDDPYGKRILEQIPSCIGFGMLSQDVTESRDYLLGKVLTSSTSGMQLSQFYGTREWNIASPLIGDFNAMNLLGVQAMALGLGLSIEQLAVLKDCAGVPGRLERVNVPGGQHIFVDYAHTPDALDNVLATLRKTGFRKIITVFGCGGNRDASKRPRMGASVARASDVVIITSDNPRKEDPQAIIADILPGVGAHPSVIVEPDRRQAIARGIELLGSDDVLLVAGKGHETYQLVGEERLSFDDRKVIRELICG